jgi:hypothetical protein
VFCVGVVAVVTGFFVEKFQVIGRSLRLFQMLDQRRHTIDQTARLFLTSQLLFTGCSITLLPFFKSSLYIAKKKQLCRKDVATLNFFYKKKNLH